MSGKISSLTFGLLMVGLVIGAAGGYFYNTSVMSSVVKQLEDSKQTLTADVESKNAQMPALSTQFNGLNSTRIGLIKDVSDLDTSKNQVRSEIIALDQKIETYNKNITELRFRGIAEPGYEVYSAYGLTFDYPKGMNFTLSEIMTEPVSERYGVLVGAIKNSTISESISYIWQYVNFVPNMQDDLSSLITNYMDEMAAYPEYKTTKGTMKTTTIDGHTAYYQSITIEGSDFVNVASYTTWYCSEEKVAYRVFFINGLSSDINHLLAYQASTICH